MTIILSAFGRLIAALALIALVLCLAGSSPHAAAFPLSTLATGALSLAPNQEN